MFSKRYPAVRFFSKHTNCLKFSHSLPFPRRALSAAALIACLLLAPVSAARAETVVYDGSDPSMLETVDSVSNSLAPSNSSTGKSTSISDNNVTLENGTVTGNVMGAVNIDDTDSVTDNSVTMNGGAMGGSIFGGYSNYGSATGNTVTMNGGTVGYNVLGGYSSGSSTGSATGNTVTMNGGSVSNSVYGGSSSGSATGNHVTMNGGTVDYDVLGGDSSTGSATGNSVTITGGTVGYDVYGGRSYPGSATGNTVTIGGTANVVGSVYGGFTIGPDDVFTGNTLVKNSDAALASVLNFETLTFGYTGNAHIGTLHLTPTGAAGTLVKLDTGSHDIVFTGTLTNGSPEDGGFEKQGLGMLTLTNAASAFRGETRVAQGTLRLAGGALGDATSTADVVKVSSGATLSGYGNIRGQTLIDPSGSLIVDGGSLAINANGFSNNLTLYSGSNISIRNGGRLDVTHELAVFGGNWSAQIDAPGFYVLANYDSLFGAANLASATVTLMNGANSGAGTVISGGGTGYDVDLTNRGQQLTLSALPTGVAARFWNGGGGNWNTNGKWSPTYALGGSNNWSDGGYAVFGADGVGGNTVTLDGFPPILYGMSFLNDGWTISGASYLTLNPAGGNHPAINVDAGASATIAAPLVSAGDWTKTGAGTLILTNDNTTLTDNITVASGTLQLGNGGATGSVGHTGSNTLHLASPGANVTFNRNDSVTYAGAITGAGSVTQAGSGFLTLSGNHSYTGETSIRGILHVSGALGYGGGTGSNDYAGNILNNGGLSFGQNASVNQILSGAISGTGALYLNSMTTLTLAGANTYTGDTYIAGGTTLKVTGTLGGAAAGNYAGSIGNAGTLIFDQGANQTISGTIGGTGSLEKRGTGTLTLTSNGNTYSGGTTVSGGTLQIGNGGNTGVVPGNITNNANVTFNRSDSVDYHGVISGAGSVTQADGYLTLSGNHSYTGETTIAGGYLTVTGTLGYGGGTGSNDYAGNINLLNNGALMFNQSASVNQILSGAISGTGALFLSSTTTLTLAGANTYTGNTLIDTGTTLKVTGTLGYRQGAGSSNDYAGVIFNDGTLIFDQGEGANQTISGAITDTGSLEKRGTGTLTLSGDTNQGAVNLSAGRMNIASGKTLNATGAFSAGSGTTLGLTLGGTLPIISANSVTIGSGATLDITGYTDGTPTIIRSAGSAISGAFTNLTLAGVTQPSGLDAFIEVGTDKIVNGSGEDLRITSVLSWNKASDAHGTFNIASGTFTLGANLANNTQTGAGTTFGWDGASLTKSGNGTLVLTGNNTADGNFNHNAGTVNLQSDWKGQYQQAAGTTLNTDDNVSIGKTGYYSVFRGAVNPSGTLNILGDAAFYGADVDFGQLTSYNKIIVAGNVDTHTFAGEVDAAGIAATESFTLLEYGSISSGINPLVIKNLGDNRGGSYIDLTNKALKVDVIAGNTTLYWDGSENTWNTNSANQNWTTGNFGTYFKNGDDVVFNNDAAYKTVNIDSVITVGTMNVIGTDYVFNVNLDNGGLINAANITNSGSASIVAAKNTSAGLSKGEANKVLVPVLNGLDADSFSSFIFSFSSTNSRIKSELSFDADSLGYWLWLAYSYSDTSGLTPNARNAAAIVDNMPANSPFLVLMDSLTDDTMVRFALANAHGEMYAAALEGTAKLQRNFNERLLGRKFLEMSSCEPCSRAGRTNGYGLWGEFTGGIYNRSNIGQYSGYDLNDYGIAFGIEKRLSQRWFGGAAFGYDNARQQLDSVWAKDTFEAFRASLYGGYTGREFYVNGYAGYAKDWHDVSRRNFAIQTMNRGKYNDDVWSTGFEIGKVMNLRNALRFVPSAGLHYVSVNGSRVFETGSSASALTVSGNDYNSLRLPVGARLNTEMRRRGVLWTPEVRAFYVAELGDTGTRVGSVFTSSTGAGTFFSDSGASGRSGGLFGAGLTAQLTKAVSVGADYDYEVWEHYERHNFGIRAAIRR